MIRDAVRTLPLAACCIGPLQVVDGVVEQDGPTSLVPLLGGRVKWAYGPLRDDLVGPKSGLGAADVRGMGIARCASPFALGWSRRAVARGPTSSYMLTK